MRALLSAFLFLAAQPAARAQEGAEATPIERALFGLRLGDALEDVRRVYPPAAEWPSQAKPHSVTRYRLTREMAKGFPRSVEALYVGFRNGALVEIEADYDEKKSGDQTVEKLAGEYALTYGEARRSGERFWWSDGRTVLRVFPAEVPGADGERAVAWRTAVQIFDRGLPSK